MFGIPFSFGLDKTALCHGIACWFDLEFLGSENRVVLSTGPDQPGTHWYQCRLLLQEPLAVNRSQSIAGSVGFIANDKFSYYINLQVALSGTHVKASNPKINLADQNYYYLYSPHLAGASSSS